MRRSGVYRVDRFDGQGTEIDLKGQTPLDAIARALEFPAWFGGNWDALEDCLSDLSWHESRETVLVIRNFTRNDELGILIDILASSAQFRTEQGASFVSVFVDPKHELDLPDLP